MVSEGLKTTVVGSMPKPDYLKIPCWVVNGKEELEFVERYNEVQKTHTADELNEQVVKATKEALEQQMEIGIDVGTDGEMRRDKYLYGFCRNLKGIDFDHPVKTRCRNDSWTGILPRVIAKISPKPIDEQSQPRSEWQMAQNMSKIPVKYTLPGPLTIADTTKNEFYKDDLELSKDLVKCVNEAVLGLVQQGCKYIQIDEPVLVRYPDKALKFAINALKDCFKGVPDDVQKIVHMCCGYPMYLDQTDYHKAEQDAYIKIAEKMDDAGFDMISIEDAHRRNNKELFQKFKKTTIILGVIDVVKSKVESVEEIHSHIEEVLEHIPRERLVIAPDCGLIFLPTNIMKDKLSNMVAAAKTI